MSKSKRGGGGGVVTVRGGRRKGLSPGVFTVEVILMKSRRSEELPPAAAANPGRAGVVLSPRPALQDGQSQQHQPQYEGFFFPRSLPEKHQEGPQGGMSWLKHLFKAQKKVSRN